jgi:ariadne-1
VSGVKNDDSGATASMSWQALLENSSPAFDNPVFDRQNSYEILSSQDLLIKQENMITSVREQLYVNREEAAILLRFYRWKMPTLVDDWLMDADAVRRKVGISEAMDVSEDDVPSTPGGSFTCPLCFDTVSKDKCIGLACGHFFCASCWTSWLSAENEKGPSAIFTTCMAEKCKEIIPEEIQMKLLPKDKKQKFKTWLIDNLIQGNRHLRWCPTPSCHRAVEYKGGGMMEIFCHCGSVFCFKCGYEGHRPADCEIVEKWVQKNSTDAENVNWIIANTKKCPKCNVFIEKNQGCNHMTCRNCKFEFCWLCKGDWTQHGSATGGFYKCNKYDTSKDKDVAAEENKIEEAKNALQKYMFYFTRFDNHDKSIKFAEQTRKKAETTMGKLQDKLGTNYQDVQFLLNAVNAVIAVSLYILAS